MIFVFVGPSGVGKTELTKQLDIPKLVSETERPPRDYEVHGVDYYFIPKGELTKEEFIKDKLDWSEYDGYLYGLSKQEYENKLKEAPIVYAILDINGVKQLKKKLPPKEIVVIYIHAPLLQIIMRLWKTRGFIKMCKRVWHAIKIREFHNKKKADFVIDNSNGEFETALSFIKTLIKLYSISRSGA